MSTKSLLFSHDQLAALTAHPRSETRRWALERLRNHHASEGARLALPRLFDPDPLVVLAARELICRSGDRSCIPELIALLPTASDQMLVDLAMILRDLDAGEAARPLWERVRALSPVNAATSRSIFSLAALADEPLRAELRREMFASDVKGTRRSAAVEVVLAGQRPADVALAATLPPWRDRHEQPAATIARALGVFESWKAHARDGLPDLEGLVLWLDADRERFSPGFLAEIAEATTADGLLRLRAEARHLIGDAAHTWRNAERLEGYRWRAAATLALLDADLAFHLRGVAVTAVVSLAGQRDDQALLERTAVRSTALLEMLSRPGMLVLPDIVDQVATLGPDAVPALRIALENGDHYWPRVRAADAIARIAADAPEACAVTVRALLKAIDEDDGDYLFEAAQRALVAIGAPAIPMLRASLREGVERDYSVLDVLGDIGTASAFDAVAEHIERAEYLDEFMILALQSCGDPRALPILEQNWNDGEFYDVLVAEALLVLTDLHQPEHPDRGDWQARIDDSRTLRDRQMSEMNRLLTRASGGALPAGPNRPEADEISALRAKRKAKRKRQKEQRRRTKKRRGKKRR